MKSKTNSILNVLRVLTWVIFLGLCIKAGALLFTFICSLFKPIVSHDLYLGLNLSQLYSYHLGYYVGLLSLVVSIWVLKAYLFYDVIKIFSKINLNNPFSAEVAKRIASTSYTALSIGILSIITSGYVKWLIKKPGGVESFSYGNGASEFLLMAAILFVISQVFNRGIEIQSENELTV